MYAFQVNQHSAVAWNSRNFLLETGMISELYLISDIVPVLNKKFLDIDIQATVECGFTLKRVNGIIGTYSQKLRTDKYSHIY